MKKILHVSDNFGGGLVTAVQGYVASASQHQHYLLVARRAGYHDGMEWAKNLAGEFPLPSSVWQAPGVIRKYYAQLQPDWVHLHSSFAGAYGRLAFLPRHKIIYTPHCYAFERRDVRPLVRFAYWLAEQILAAGNATVAAASPHEAACARRMLLPQNTLLLPNVPVIPDTAFGVRRAYRRGTRLRIAMVGRLCPQKDPDFFIATVKAAQQQDLPVDFVWLGGGDDAWQSQLTQLGVEVSGWISHAEILQKLAQCDVYFHTALWESGPLSVLEAAQLGLMMVCRSIPAIAMLPVQPGVQTPAEAVAMFAALNRGAIPAGLTAINETLNGIYNFPAQRAALARLYEGAR